MASNHKTKGITRVIQWLFGKKNSKGNNIYQQFGRWFTNRDIHTGQRKGDPDTYNVMNQNGDFTYKDNTTGIVRLWNNITGKTNQNKDIALNNWTQQYNKPEHQKQLELEAGYNPNLVASSGPVEFTPQPIADTSTSAELDGATSLMDLLKKAKDIKSSSLRNASQVLDNMAKTLDIPRREVDNAINKARRDTNLSEIIRGMTLKLTNENAQLVNDGLDEQNRSVQLRTQSLLDSISNAIAQQNSKDWLEPDPFSDSGGMRLNQLGKERLRNKNASENSRWLIDVADSTKKAFEQQFYSDTGKYPDWNVDVFDEQFNTQILGMLDKMDDGLAKTIVLGVISAIRSLSGSVGIGPMKLGFKP